MKKRAISLLEVMVCFGLLSLLLTTLFYWYHSLSRGREEFKNLKAPLMEERYAHQRLQSLIPKMEEPLFLAEDHSLVFIFDRGPYIIPELSGKVLGKLYHDSEARSLCLGIWPKPDRERTPRTPCQTLTLLDGVASCSFELYHPPDPSSSKVVDPKEVGNTTPREGWQEEWKISFHRLPALVKLSVVRDPQKGLESRTIEYHFDLPIPVIYPKRTA
jgi:hypothetical protein